MVARDESGIDRPHQRPLGRGVARFVGEPAAPALGPTVIGGRIDEEAPHGLDRLRLGIAPEVRHGRSEAAEGEGEVGLVLGHGLQQISGEDGVTVAGRGEPKLAVQAAVIGILEQSGEACQCGLGLCDSPCLVIRQERQQRFREPGEVP